MNIQESIRFGLHFRKMTRKELAKLCGVTYGNICLWAAGKTIPNGENIVNLSNAFNVKASIFISWGEVE